MPDPDGRPTDAALRRWAAYASAAIPLVVCAVAAWISERNADLDARNEFEDRIADVRRDFRDRVGPYIEVTRGAAGLFRGGRDVPPAEFHSFAESMGVPDRFPGLLGLGFVRVFPRERTAEVEAAMRRDMTPAARVWPDGDGATRAVVVLATPATAGNLAAVGFDMASVPDRLAAIERARDSGHPSATGKVGLVQDPSGPSMPGFIVFFPIYGGDRVPGSLEERRGSFVGAVAGGIAVDPMFQAVLLEEEIRGIAFRVHAGSAPTAANLVHAFGTGIPDDPGVPSERIEVRIADMPWTIDFRATGLQEGAAYHAPVLALLLVGLLSSGTVLVVLRAQGRARRSAEEALAGLRDSRASLREREGMIREITENIEEAFWVLDPATGGCVFVSPSFERIWGRPLGDFARVPEEWAAALHPEDRDRVLAALEPVKSKGGTCVQTYRILRPDGSVRWVRDKATAVLDAGGVVERVYGVAEDVTDQRALEEQFQVAQKMEAVGRLAAGIAHDFNNLLTVIIGFGQLARSKAPAGSPTAKHLDEVVRAGNRAGELTRQLLIFARKQPLERVSLDVNDAVRGTETMLRRVIGPDVEIVLGLSPVPARVVADASQVEQVLMNLAVNARDAMPDGGRLTIETEVISLDEGAARMAQGVAAGTYVRLRVTDTGTGMTEEVQKHVFEPFFTTKDIGKGTGLGLATVFGIVKGSGGEVRICSRPGEGASFSIYLPFDGSPESATAPAEREAEGPWEPLAILLVDDEPAVRAMALEVLKGEGHMVLVAGDAREARDAWRDHGNSVDLLVTDIGLPGENGISLARSLVSDRPDLRVILISGYSESTAGGTLDLPPWARFLPKPFGPRELRLKVRETFPAAKIPGPAG